jgi:glycosyltransferase involved in cell wall biosynthesis
VAGKRVLFVSSVENMPWGGAEELWSQTALELVARGCTVSANIAAWPPAARKSYAATEQIFRRQVSKLKERGVEVWLRPNPYPLRRRAWCVLITPQTGPMTRDVQRMIAARTPQLVVISDGAPFPPLDLLEMCAMKRLPFAVMVQCNHYFWWPDDDVAARYRSVLTAARRCFFVSDANRCIAEKQIGCELPNAEVIRNPFNVRFDASPPWPPLGGDDQWHFACVARLEPPGKGQDILFEVFADRAWATRNWRLHMYGEGENRGTLQWLAERLGLADRVVFEGHVADIEQIWSQNHALVMPSRIEGLPLAVIEAMLCERPVVATDVAASEVVEDGVSGFLADAPTVRGMGDALERFWANRERAKEIGARAAERIRSLVPPDPVGVFADKIEELAG